MQWAGNRPRKGHVLDRIEDNLFLPLHPATRADFVRGAGDELGLSGRTAKMRSLRSSSALACNFFDPWRGANLRPLAAALELSGEYDELAFEQRVPHGLKGIPPNIDVMLFGRHACPVGIEAKFCEPYDHIGPRPPLDSKYFPEEPGRWADLGLERTQKLARAVGTTAEYSRLDAGQLLKHILALATTFPEWRPICLRYVWFDAGGAADARHRDESRAFRSGLGDEVDFRALSYNELFARLASQPEPAPGYLAYLKARYFAA